MSDDDDDFVDAAEHEEDGSGIQAQTQKQQQQQQRGFTNVALPGAELNSRSSTADISMLPVLR